MMALLLLVLTLIGGLAVAAVLAWLVAVTVVADIDDDGDGA